MNNIDSIKSWGKNTWENSNNIDKNLQKKGISDIRELKASERQLLIDVINGKTKNEDNQDVVKLNTKLQAMSKANYKSTRSNWFWSDISRSRKNSKGRVSTTVALNALNMFYTRENSINEMKKQLTTSFNALSADPSKAKRELDFCVKQFCALHKEGIPDSEAQKWEKLLVGKYKELYGHKTAEDRFIDAQTHYNTNLTYPRRYKDTFE